MSAMHEELNRVVGLLKDVTKTPVGAKTVYSGYLNQQHVCVVFSGWGKVAAAMTATLLIERFNVNELVFTGVAGGISPELEIGDIVIADRLVQHDMDCAGVLGIQRFEIPLLSLTEIPSTASLQDKSMQSAQAYLSDDLENDVPKDELVSLGISNPSIHTGLIASGDQFISSVEKQQELLTDLPDLLAVEMEGAAVAQVAYEYQLPFVVIRVISDKANDESIVDFPRFIENVASHFTAGIVNRMIR